ncbi:MAG TPA: TetR/AcrR family transcriptional regulator [Alphaproteobacteria bacterium]|nr:TetR/AcrR family transcriptional regulator [Alphaproteobacteria bacterium]
MTLQHSDPPDSAAGQAEARGGPPGRAPSRPRQASEQRILEAAERVFAEQGFGGASMAAIAAAAGLPKANLHYYFGTKEGLYRAVLANILELWLHSTDVLTPERDPAEAIAEYVRAKMGYSRLRPHASKLFATELLHGAPQAWDFLAQDVRQTVEARSVVIRQWIAEGRIAPVDPPHLFFAIWAMTQTYADFDIQVKAVLGRDPLDDSGFDEAVAAVVTFALRACGLPSD